MQMEVHVTSTNCPWKGPSYKNSQCTLMIRMVRQKLPLTQKELQDDPKAGATPVKTGNNKQHHDHLCSFASFNTPLLVMLIKKNLHISGLFWNNIPWPDETKTELFGDNSAHVWRKKGYTYNPKNTVPTVKHGGGCIAIWYCVSANATASKETWMVWRTGTY